MSKTADKLIAKATSVFVSQSMKGMQSAIKECEMAGLHNEAKIISDYRKKLQAILSGGQIQASTIDRSGAVEELETANTHGENNNLNTVSKVLPK